MSFYTKFKTFAFSFALFSALQANAKEFSYIENFDENEVSDVAELPEGWTSEVTSQYSPIKIYAGSYTGVGAHSGNTALGTLASMAGGRDDWAFSKAISLKKGTEYTVSYWLKAAGGSYPGDPFTTFVSLKVGTAQNKEAMTTELGKTSKRYADWEKVTYTFTPEADGDYFFGFNITAQMYNAGPLGIDDFEITGEETETGGGTVTPGGGETGGETETKTELLNMNFDNDDDFANGATLPEGWASTGTYAFNRNTGAYFGTGAHSGDYVFGTAANSAEMNRNEKFYTKLISMKAGKEYTLNFWFMAPGGAADYYATQIETTVGTSQSAEGVVKTLGTTPARTRYTEWTNLEYKFTPETDGDYCFGFGLITELFNAGPVAFDDIVVNGPSESGTVTPDPGEDDDDKETVELPYSQSFDNENKDYDGTTFVPKGWLATGTSTFVTANEDDMPARDGIYYLLAPESSISRDDRIYTPFFKLEAGVEYNAEFYLYMPGDEDMASDFSFTVGTEQDSEFHTTTLLNLPEYQNTSWKKFTVPFTPEKTGKYCFSFALGGAAAYAGEVCIDLFTLRAPGMIAKPVAGFAPDAAYSLFQSSNIVSSENAPVRMINYSTDGETFEWTATGATPETSTEKEPSFAFPAAGKYDITLKVTNSKGESTTKRTVNVEMIGADPESQFGIVPYSGNDSQISRDYIMKYDTDPDYDYVTGYNHYYHKLAQKFSMPESEDMEYTISQFSFGCNFFQLTNDPNKNDKKKPFSIVFYGDKNGRPDTDNVLARQDLTIEEAFNTTGNSSFEMRNIKMKEPVTFKAKTFYASLEFSPEMTIDITGSGLYRSFIALGAYRSQTKETSFFVMPENMPEGSLTKADGQFYPVDVYDADYKGLGLQLAAWVKAGPTGTTEIAIAPDGTTAFATRIDGNSLIVSGTKAGDAVTVFDTTGRIIAQKKAEGNSATINVNAPAGMYIVSTPAGTQKFIKK